MEILNWVVRETLVPLWVKASEMWEDKGAQAVALLGTPDPSCLQLSHGQERLRAQRKLGLQRIWRDRPPL